MANRMHESTDKILSNIVLRSMGDTREGRAALQTFLSATEKEQGILRSDAVLHCFVELCTTHVVPEIKLLNPMPYHCFRNFF